MRIVCTRGPSLARLLLTLPVALSPFLVTPLAAQPAEVVWADRGLFADDERFSVGQRIDPFEPTVVADARNDCVVVVSPAGVQVLRLSDGALLRSIGALHGLRMLPGRSVSPDGQIVVCRDSIRRLQVRDFATRERVAERSLLTSQERLFAHVSSGADRVLLLGESQLVLATLPALDTVWTRSLPYSAPRCVDISLDGRRYLAHSNARLVVGDMLTGDTLWSLPYGATDFMHRVAFVDSGAVVVGYSGGSIYVFDAASGRLDRTIADRFTNPYTAMTAEPGGRRVVTWHRWTPSDSATIVDVLDGRKERFDIPDDGPHEAYWNGLDLDGTRLYTIAGGGSLRSSPSRPVAFGRSVIDGGGSDLGRPAVSRDGTTIATALDWRLSIYDAATGRLRASARRTDETRSFVAFAPAGNRLVVASVDDNLVTVHDTTTRILARRRLAGALSSPPTYSPDGSLVAIGRISGHIDIIGADSLTTRATLVGHGGVVRRLAFDAGGALLFSAGDDGVVNRWRVASGTLERTIENPLRSPVRDLLVCRRSDHLIWLAADGRIVESSPDGADLRTIAAVAGLEHLDLSDDERAVIASGSTTLAIDRASGRILHRYTDSLDFIATRTHATVVPGSGRFVSGAGDGDLVLWQYAGLVHPTAVGADPPSPPCETSTGTSIPVTIHDILGRPRLRTMAMVRNGRPFVAPSTIVGLPAGLYLLVDGCGGASTILLP